MRPRTTIARTALLLVCTAVFAGTAFAGDKPKDDAPGNSGNAPGQQKKAEQPPAAAAQAPPGQAKKAEQPQAAAAQASPGQAKKAEKQAAKTEKKQAKAEQKSAKAAAKQNRQSGSFKATSSGTDLKRGMDHKHTICHATGSASNPFVVITPSISGVFNGHMGHQGGEDIIPPFTYKGETYSQNWDAAGQALFANGCESVTAAQTTTAQTTTSSTTTTTTTTTQECPPTTRTITEVVEGGVFHKTGSATNPYVFIRPAKNSAHYTKHADDIIVEDETVTRTIVVAGNCDVTTTTQGGSTTTVTGPTQTVTLAGSTVTVAGQTVTVAGQTVTTGGETTREEAGGVLGAQSPPGAGAPAGEDDEAGGVLDAVASIGQTAVTGTLPFTGIPLWIAALVGGGLLAAGVALRRTT